MSRMKTPTLRPRVAHTTTKAVTAPRAARFGRSGALLGSVTYRFSQAEVPRRGNLELVREALPIIGASASIDEAPVDGQEIAE